MYILSRDGWVNIFMVLVLLNHGSQQKKLPKFLARTAMMTEHLLVQVYIPNSLETSLIQKAHTPAHAHMHTHTYAHVGARTHTHTHTHFHHQPVG